MNESLKRPAVLLVNLGSPLKPTPLGIAAFLRQFLWDRRVVKLPRVIWWMILHFLVLPFRSKRVAGLYQKIWMTEGSPLIVYTQRLAERLEIELTKQNGFPLPVMVAMTYGKPSMQTVVSEIVKKGISHLVILPLFPQYSSTTTAAVFDSVTSQFMNKRVPSTYFISHYCHEHPYLSALASSISNHWELHGQSQKLLFSFHGLPEQEIMNGDPYFEMCQATAKGVADILKIPENYWKVAFQSRFGFKPWIQPSIENQLMEWVGEGVQSVLVIAPSFAVDCLETLEELAIRTQALFLKAGGKKFHYLPALNDSELHVSALAGFVQKYF